MLEELKTHKIAYAVLLFGLVVIGVTYFALWPSIAWQRVFAFGLILFYFAWGVLTHLKTKRITRGVILEYFAVASLAGLLLFIITL